MTVILLMVASRYFVVGVLFAAWAGTTTLLMPLYRQLKFLLADPSLNGHRAGAVAGVALTVTGALALLLLVPVPQRSLAQGVVWTPEESWVRAGSSGFIASVPASPGDDVARGQVLVQGEDAVLSARATMLEAEVREIETRYAAAIAVDRIAAATIEQELQFARERLAEARRQVRELSVTSSTDGKFVLDQPAQDLPGHFIHRGTPVGYVIDDAAPIVRVVVAQNYVDLVRHRLRNVQVRLADDFGTTRQASVIREVPGATDELPSLALGIGGGGNIAMDPASDGLRAFQTLFQFDIEVEGGAEIERLGQRAYVRFDFGPEPLAYRWYRTARRVFLKNFNV